MLRQDLGGDGHGVLSRRGGIRPDLQRQLVEIGHVADTRILDRIIDLIHRGIQRVDRDHTNGRLRRLVPISRNIAAAAAHGDLHVQHGIGSERADVQILIQDLHIVVGLDVAGRDFTLAGGININRLHAVTIHLKDDALDVQDDLSDILLHTGDCGKLMLDARDLDGGRSGTRQRGKQNPSQ